MPTLEALLASRHEVCGVVSQPDRRKGRGRKLAPSPVSAVALREDLPLLRPPKVGEDEIVESLRRLSPDLGVVVAFGQFLPKKIRELPSLGYLVNGHASLLPAYRGAAPIARAILAGETRTGISAMRVEREMDAGAWAVQRSLEIGPDEGPRARSSTAEPIQLEEGVRATTYRVKKGYYRDVETLLEAEVSSLRARHASYLDDLVTRFARGDF